MANTYTYDLTTTLGQVRLACGDVPDIATGTAFFTDAEIAYFIQVSTPAPPAPPNLAQIAAIAAIEAADPQIADLIVATSPPLPSMPANLVQIAAIAALESWSRRLAQRPKLYLGDYQEDNTATVKALQAAADLLRVQNDDLADDPAITIFGGACYHPFY